MNAWWTDRVHMLRLIELNCHKYQMTLFSNIINKKNWRKIHFQSALVHKIIDCTQNPMAKYLHTKQSQTSLEGKSWKSSPQGSILFKIHNVLRSLWKFIERERNAILAWGSELTNNTSLQCWSDFHNNFCVFDARPVGNFNIHFGKVN